MKDFKCPQQFDTIEPEWRRVIKKAECIAKHMKHDKDFTRDEYIEFRETVLNMKAESEFLTYVQGFYNMV